MADEQNTNWDYSPSGDSGVVSSDDSNSTTNQENITWSAKEFIEHDHSTSWYIILIIGSAILAIAIFFITKDYFAAGAVVTVGIISAVYAGHKPEELDYELTKKAIKIGDKTYSYSLFKSFSIAHEGGHTSINLEPVKRFMPPMTLYFPSEEEKQITNAIGNHLPLQDHQTNIADRLSRRLRL